MSVITAMLVGKLREAIATAQESVAGNCRNADDSARTISFRKFLGEDPEAMGRKTSLVIRALSGTVLLEKEDVAAGMPISKIIDDLCETTGAQKETVQLCSGGQILRHSSRLHESFPASFMNDDEDDEDDKPLELTVMRLSGPPITVKAMSGRDITLMDGLPSVGSRCHLDRSYRFISLGDFAGREGMRYLSTCNDDKNMPVRVVMWRLEVIVPVVVYLNFRSEGHVRHTGEWLQEGGWKLRNDMRGTVSTGVPNGPYNGPIYSKTVDSGEIELMGSNCSEGTYFVFVEACM